MAKENYVLRRLAPVQREDYKKIRLEALHTDPGVFGSNYQREAAYSQQDWVALLENENCAMFGLYDQDDIVGLTGVVMDRNDASNAILIASFVREPHRGKGLSKLFYRTRIAWAREKGCARITVSHRAGNESSKAANQAFNFTYTHSREVEWPDGTVAAELMYVLVL
ncbi:MAG: hypothetical protein K0R59_3716 [Sphingobacterium sp.]|nr:hypothetical protein [Sphingobacterium sp.]